MIDPTPFDSREASKDLYKKKEEVFVTVYMRRTGDKEPPRIWRCSNDGLPVIEYFGMEMVSIFEGKMIEAHSGIDALCKRCYTKYRFIV